MLTAGTHLAVWGDPIAHSRSPLLHAAAYRTLGVDWDYTRRQVDVAGFAAALGGLDASWRGLSLTMPLKGVAFAAAATRDRHAELTGAVNTLWHADGAWHGSNTDVEGIARDLREHGFADVASVRIVGAGATATSALCATAELGARRVHVRARRPQAAASLVALGERLGLVVDAWPWDARDMPAAPLTFAALPGGVALDATSCDAVARGGGTLYDAVYGHWPTDLARAWERADQAAVAGWGMLLHQALLQVRVFRTGHADESLPDEPTVLAAMRAALRAG